MSDYVTNIRNYGLTIYNQIETGNPDFWIPNKKLEEILDKSMVGFSVFGYPLRTRSKVIKTKICESLGYPVPKSFKKTQPRFFGQNFDVYTQKSTNLQVWNEDLNPTRRYVIIKISNKDIVEKAKVVDGATLSKLDTTGTLTQKYQARMIEDNIKCSLTVPKDTDNILPLIQSPPFSVNYDKSSTSIPSNNELLPIKEVFHRLKKIIGLKLNLIGADQERNRGFFLHDMICKALGYKKADDDGTYPDIKHQLLEIKLQTSPTIDLGLVLPNDNNPLAVPKIKNINIRHCDVRYVIVNASVEAQFLIIQNIFLTNGEAFFDFFPRFEGKVLNKKIQMHLPCDFFL